MQESSLLIRQFTPDIEPGFWEMLDRFTFHIDHNYYERCMERHENGELLLIIASIEGREVGYCLLNWQPKYAYFKKQSLPEIQDLNVLSHYRRRGIGRTLVDYCEGLARDKGHKEMGIGVGLNSSFGAAQRLYVCHGYIPDGCGVSYDRKQVAAGEFRPIDDNLSLMMIKTLN
ncbi:MAG: GNAT family N-acetyltransferase [Zetaproteobacteria bacterium]|nr:MAG: GNAT family N-acetyltransferase [Zetaproteobacteria bacterium]